MNVTINAVNFEMAEKLEQFIDKKMSRFARHLSADDKVEIRMSVVKPQTNDNKEVKIRIAGLFAGRYRRLSVGSGDAVGAPQERLIEALA